MSKTKSDFPVGSRVKYVGSYTPSLDKLGTVDDRALMFAPAVNVAVTWDQGGKGSEHPMALEIIPQAPDKTYTPELIDTLVTVYTDAYNPAPRSGEGRIPNGLKAVLEHLGYVDAHPLPQEDGAIVTGRRGSVATRRNGRWWVAGSSLGQDDDELLRSFGTEWTQIR